MGAGAVGHSGTSLRESTTEFVHSLWTSTPTSVDDARVGVAYAYELRRGEEILSTGRLTAERELVPGDEAAVASILASVRGGLSERRGTAHP
jgi:hypothetical protein